MCDNSILMKKMMNLSSRVSSATVQCDELLNWYLYLLTHMSQQRIVEKNKAGSPPSRATPVSRQSPGPNGFNNLTPGFTSLMGVTIMTVLLIISIMTILFIMTIITMLLIIHDHHDHPVDDDHHDHDDDNDDVQGWWPVKAPDLQRPPLSSPLSIAMATNRYSHHTDDDDDYHHRQSDWSEAKVVKYY